MRPGEGQPRRSQAGVRGLPAVPEGTDRAGRRRWQNHWHSARLPELRGPDSPAQKQCPGSSEKGLAGPAVPAHTCQDLGPHIPGQGAGAEEARATAAQQAPR